MLLIAHRGASGHAPENTMAAFRRAMAMNVAAIELDVHQTADGALAVIHDEDLKRVGGRLIEIRRLNFAALSNIDVGSWFDARFSSERIPRLEAVLDLAQGCAQIHVEIKEGSQRYPGIEKKVVSLIAARRAWEQVIVSSFDHHALFTVRQIDARVRIGYLKGATSFKTAWREIAQLKAESLHIGLRQISAKIVRDAHARGVRILVYTVNTEPGITKLLKLGVDGVFSNYPELAHLCRA